MQLDLFRDGQSDYFQAVAALRGLDLNACRAALETHRRQFPCGLDPEPLAHAARWLADRLPGPSAHAVEAGHRGLTLVRALRERRGTAAVEAVGAELARQIAKSIARRCLEAAARAGLDPAEPLDQGLPWGVFHLFAGNCTGAQRSVEAFLQSKAQTPLAFLALADALWLQGRRDRALSAYREGYLLDATGGGWRIECSEVAAARDSLLLQWGPDWWAVGAYLEGVFPRFPPASPAGARRQWERFSARRAAWLRGDPVQVPLFWDGLALSESGESLFRCTGAYLGLARTTLRDLHPLAWEQHWENLGGDACGL